MSQYYEIMNSMEEWFQLGFQNYEKEIKIPKLPPMTYNYKCDYYTGRYYIPPSTVMALVHFRNCAKEKNIAYQPAGEIEKYVYNNCTPEMEFNYRKKSELNYRVPVNELIARSVYETNYSDHDKLSVSDPENDVIYYYLSVLMITKHPAFKKILLNLQSGAYDTILYQATNLLKYQSTNVYLPKVELSFYLPYLELIYFVGLIVPPVDVDKKIATDAEVMQKVNERHTEQQKIFCEHIGITNCRPIIRGRTVKRIITFWKRCPKFRRVIIEAVLKPPVPEGSLRIMEDQTIRQLKQLWFKDVSEGGPLSDFFECYSFAINPITEAHKIPAVVADSEIVKDLYQKLVDAVDGDEDRTRFAPFLKSNEKFFKQYDVKNYPNLFYAVKSLQYDNNKKDNLDWIQFVAMQPVSVPFKEIDSKLAVPLTNNKNNNEKRIETVD